MGLDCSNPPDSRPQRDSIPLDDPSIPSFSSASDRYGGWSGFIGKSVVSGVYQVVYGRLALQHLFLCIYVL